MGGKFFPPTNEVCEGYVFTGVYLSTGVEVHPSKHWVGGVCPGGVCLGVSAKGGVCRGGGVGPEADTPQQRQAHTPLHGY